MRYIEDIDRMELREVAAFVEVARCGSFSQAAARLGYVQSTVSAQIGSLERDLGCSLFDRLPRTVCLTPAGRALLPYAEQLVDVAAAGRAAATAAASPGGELTGPITISAPETLLTYRLPGLLSRFRARHPRVDVGMRPTAVGRFRGRTREAVANGSVDLALVLDTPLAIPGFRCEPLVRESIRVIAPPAHRLASAASVHPADLDGEPLLMPEAPESGCAYRGQFERQLADAHVDRAGALEFASIEAVKQCVIAGMGLAVLPAVAVDSDIEAGRLAALTWSEPFDVVTQIVWSHRRSPTPEMLAFISLARSEVGEESDKRGSQDNSE